MKRHRFTQALALTAVLLGGAALANPAAAAAASQLAFVNPPQTCATLPTLLQVGLRDASGAPVVPVVPRLISLIATGAKPVYAWTGYNGVATFTAVGDATATAATTYTAASTGLASVGLSLVPGKSTKAPANIQVLIDGGNPAQTGHPFPVLITEQDSTGNCLASSAYKAPTITLTGTSSQNATLSSTAIAGTTGGFNSTVSLSGSLFALNASVGKLSAQSQAFSISPVPLSIETTMGNQQQIYQWMSVPLTVTAYDASAKPAAGAMLTFTSSFGQTLNALAGSDGTASVTMNKPADPGDFTVTVTGTTAGRTLKPATFNDTYAYPLHYTWGGATMGEIFTWFASTQMVVPSLSVNVVVTTPAGKPAPNVPITWIWLWPNTIPMVAITDATGTASPLPTYPPSLTGCSNLQQIPLAGTAPDGTSNVLTLLFDFTYTNPC